MVFEKLDEFKKDLKTLLKKYRSLNDDLQVVKQILEALPDERPPFSYRLDNLGVETCIIKVKKIACKSLKGKGINSGLRLIYAYFEAIDEIKKEEEILQIARDAKIIMIELYHKNTKQNEDRVRIKKYFK